MARVAKEAEKGGTHRGKELDEDRLAVGQLIVVVRGEVVSGNRGQDGEEDESTHHVYREKGKRLERGFFYTRRVSF